jgi:hypothetical protein
MSEYWPPLVVRRWQGVLYSKSPDAQFDWDHDPIEEAVISRRLHELRGLVVGQVAEVESLLLHIAQETRDRYPGTLPMRQKGKGAGGALQDVGKLLATLGLGDELSGELERIGRVIRQRNRLVHGVIHIGFSRLGPHAPLEPVIYLLFENDGSEAPLPVDQHGIAGPPGPGDADDEEDVELDEVALKKYLNRAYDALAAGLVILERVDGELPERILVQSR